ncbi:interleukin-10 [Paramormyrops kingsleyae]|uniref:Interleukin family protein n=1 Tax=Paramormyrops kingsleyae TaxID=1676925 RepID=A0A3B3RN78_9TELE|nr:interleukin-10 [Paramormyrops kingsleyae]
MLFSTFTFLSFFIIAVVFDSSANCIHCDKFVEGFPAKLKELRKTFSRIKNYYEANDNTDTALLDDTILQDFKSPSGCHAMNDILRFYLDTVLPTAATKAPRLHTPDISIISGIFSGLKKDVIACKKYFSCKKPFSLEIITSTYKNMNVDGLYKAMGELDLLFNYIEEYLVSKRSRK